VSCSKENTLSVLSNYSRLCCNAFASRSSIEVTHVVAPVGAVGIVGDVGHTRGTSHVVRVLPHVRMSVLLGVGVRLARGHLVRVRHLVLVAHSLGWQCLSGDLWVLQHKHVVFSLGDRVDCLYLHFFGVRYAHLCSHGLGIRNFFGHDVFNGFVIRHDSFYRSCHLLRDHHCHDRGDHARLGDRGEEGLLVFLGVKVLFRHHR